MNELTPEQTETAYKELLVKFPKIERLPVDPPIAGQNYALFSFKFLPKPVNNTYGFLKFRGCFATEDEYIKHAKNIIRTVDSKHHLFPYSQGRWMPITLNDDFVKEVLEVGQNDEMVNLFNNQQSQDQQADAQKVRQIKNREKQLLEEAQKKEFDNNSLDYFAQKVMQLTQLESWLEQVRKRKRDMLKALKETKTEVVRLENEHPEYRDKVDEKIREIKESIGLPEDAPIDRPSITPSMM